MSRDRMFVCCLRQDVSNDGLNPAEIAQENENDHVINYMGGRDHYRIVEVSTV